LAELYKLNGQCLKLINSNSLKQQQEQQQQQQKLHQRSEINEFFKSQQEKEYQQHLIKASTNRQVVTNYKMKKITSHNQINAATIISSYCDSYLQRTSDNLNEQNMWPPQKYKICLKYINSLDYSMPNNSKSFKSTYSQMPSNEPYEINNLKNKQNNYEIKINENKYPVQIKFNLESSNISSTTKAVSNTNNFKKCYTLRNTPAYKECFIKHYKCYKYKNDLEKLKNCRKKFNILIPSKLLVVKN
jgi:hypothetical protein